MMKCVPLRLDGHTIAQIDLVANHRGMSRTAVIREIVDDYVSDLNARALAVAAITAIGSQSIAPDETEMCDACDGSGFGVGDTYCGKCGGAGGYPLAKDEERHA